MKKQIAQHLRRLAARLDPPPPKRSPFADYTSTASQTTYTVTWQ